jgi:bacteriocin biosynthesis cyclodehydratase domain-containing protein
MRSTRAVLGVSFCEPCIIIIVVYYEKVEYMTIDQMSDSAPSQVENISHNGVADEQLVLNRYLIIVYCDDNEVLVKHGTRSVYSEIIRDDAKTRLLGKILRNLRTPASLADLARHGVVTADQVPAATEIVGHLVSRGILIDPRTDPARAYLDTIFDAPAAGPDRLRTASIGLIGCGQLGAHIASEFALLRPRGLVLLDPRPVPQEGWQYLGNLASAPVERSLDAALAARLDHTGLEQLEVMAADDIARDDAVGRVFERADFVVVAYETFSPTLLHAANEQALRHRVPWMSAYFDGSEAVIGPTCVPGETCCYHEFEIQSEATLTFRGEHLLFKEALVDHTGNERLDSAALVLPPYAMVAAGLAVTSALRFLVKGNTFTSGRAIRLNFETLSIDFQDVFKLPRCPACSGERPSYRQLFL